MTYTTYLCNSRYRRSRRVIIVCAIVFLFMVTVNYYTSISKIYNWRCHDDADKHIVQQSQDLLFEEQANSGVLRILRILEITPIVLNPVHLETMNEGKKLQASDVIEDGISIGISISDLSYIQKVLSARADISLSTHTDYLPSEVVRSLHGEDSLWTRSTVTHKQVLCVTIHFGASSFSMVVMYTTPHYVFVPSCLHQQKDHVFASAVLGETPLVFDRFGYEHMYIDDIPIWIPVDVPEYLRQFPSAHFHPCRRDLAIKLQSSSEKPERVRIMMTAMVYLKTKLNHLGKSPMLSSGSLLGWYRQCGLIYNSSDFDFTLFRGHLDAKLHYALMADPNIHGVTFNIPEVGFHYQIHVLGQVRMDLYFLYDTDQSDLVYFGEWAPERDLLKAYLPRSEVCSAILLGHRFNVPCRVVSVIEAEYGRHWRKRVAVWDWATSPSNVRNFGPWSDEIWRRAHMNLSDSAHVAQQL